MSPHSAMRIIDRAIRDADPIITNDEVEQALDRLWDLVLKGA